MCSKVSTSTFRKANLFPSWAHRVRESPLLLNILGILDSYDTGEYYLNGTLIKNLSETKAAEYRNRMIGSSSSPSISFPSRMQWRMWRFLSFIKE